MATVGARPGARRLALVRSCRDSNTALRVTSAPVPAGGGQRHQGQRGSLEHAPADALQEVARIAAVGGQRRHRLAGVDGAAAAEGDHRLAALGQRPLGGHADQIHRWLGRHRQLDHLVLGLQQRPAQALGPLRRAAGDQEDALDPQPAHHLRHLGLGARAEAHARAGREVEHHEQRLPRFALD
jgi:hypothetical protein